MTVAARMAQRWFRRNPEWLAWATKVTGVQGLRNIMRRSSRNAYPAEIPPWVNVTFWALCGKRWDGKNFTAASRAGGFPSQAAAQRAGRRFAALKHLFFHQVLWITLWIKATCLAKVFDSQGIFILHSKQAGNFII